ncbi:AMP-binding protein [bacterium]|nr:AMP-binding protein [bacterium]
MLRKHDQIALIWKDQKITYQTLHEKITGYASLLDNKPCTKVAIFAENRLEWVYAFYAGWKKGCINIPIDAMSSADEVAYVLEDAQPEIVFCSEKSRVVMEQAISQSPHKPHMYVFEEISADPGRSEAAAPDFPEVKADDTAVFIYTSGTTGSPKGVMLSYRNLYTNINDVSQHIPIYKPQYRVMVLLPMHHILPLLGSLICPLYVGATAVMCPSLASEDVLATLQDHKVNIIIGVPKFYEKIRKGVRDKINKSIVAKLVFKLAALINSPALSKKIFKQVHAKMGGEIMYLVCGGAAIDPETQRDYRTLGFDMLLGYGMTEAAPMITFTRPGTGKSGASGQSLTCTTVKIEQGEVLAQGANIMQGYYNRPEETAEVLKDGWLHTGDLGQLDDNGFLTITGRKKEIIVISTGKNINPAEVEAKLKKINFLITEVGVYARGDLLQAVIFPDFQALHDQGVVNIKEMFFSKVIDQYNKNVSDYKRIRNIGICKTELPKTRLGKLKRFELEFIIEKGKESKRSAVPEQEFEELLVLKKYLKEQTHQTIYCDDHLEIDLGLDSLDRVSLQVFLKNTFGIDEQENIFLDYPTVGKMADFIRENKKKITVEAIQWGDVFKTKLAVRLPRTWLTLSVIRVFGAWFLYMYFRVRGEGIENLPDKPCIIAPNHQSYFDGPFVAMFFKFKFLKRTYFYAKAKHVRYWWLKFLAGTNNIIIMDIDKNLKLSMQKMAEALKRGKNVIIFPEGTRSRDGRIGVFKKTFAILSRELNVPVVPVAISGAYQALPAGSVFPKFFKPIRVRFLKPVYPERFSYEEIREKVLTLIQSGIK